MHYLWILFQTAIWTTILGLTGILISFFEPKKGKTLGAFANLWAKLILFFGGITYSVKGLENLRPDGTYIFAGNHASGFDILLAFAGLPYWLVSISKIELKSVPILGWVMKTAGHIFVDRSHHEKAIESLENAKRSLREIPRSVLLFPEGTRTKDGKLHPFKRGGLLVGIETGIPIVPIAFVKTFEMLEKTSWNLNNQPIEMRIGFPIPPGEYNFESRRELAHYVQSEVQKLLDQS
ncbi:MAG: hypothetical protein CMG57_01380 [Candidatus Marinimicrobia bacterium]|nr:hypothetical protein [Candidatus Neomarinimicrobiota bacterium]